MNITPAAQATNSTNFKGIIPKKIDLEKLSNSFNREFQTNLLNNFNSIKKSKAVDLFLNESAGKYNDAAIITKKVFKTIKGDEIPVGSKIHTNCASWNSTNVNNGKLEIDVKIDDNNYGNLSLDFGSDEKAEQAKKMLTAYAGKPYINDTPIIAALMDMAERAKEPLSKLNDIFSLLK